MNKMNKHSKIYIAGHNGMVGNAILKLLKAEGFKNLICKSSKELDLRNQKEVESFFKKNKPEYVFLCAAKVGGIKANNTFKAEFLYDNLNIQNNVINSAYKFNTRKLLFLGSSCIYPKLSEQPIKEEYLLSGFLEKTNEPYAIAKIAGIKLCEYYRHQYGCNFISAMPSNLYGKNDNFDEENSHVLPALIRKFHKAKIEKLKEVVLWGTGKPRREFLYVDDLAEACLILMHKYNDSQHINIGYGEDITIRELAGKIADNIGYRGIIKFDNCTPDGTFQKLLDSSKIKTLNWSPNTSLDEGIKITIDYYKQTFKIEEN